MIHDRAADAGGTGDVLDGDAFVAALGEQLLGDVEQLLFPLFAGETSRSEQLIKLRRQTIERIADVASPCPVGLDRPSLLAAAHVVSGIGEQLGHWWQAHPEEELDHVLRMYVAAVGGAVRGLLTVCEDVNRP